MPIDIERFAEARDEELTDTTNAEKVVRFLVQHGDKAYTPAEIAEGAGVKRSSISTVLRRLENQDLVRHKGDYWAIGDIDRVTEAFRLHQVMEDLNERFGTEDLDEWRAAASEDARQ